MIIIRLIYLLIFAFPLGQFGRIAIRPGINVYAHDMVVIAIILAGMFKLIKTRRFIIPKLWKPLLLFTGAMALSLLVSFTHTKPLEAIYGSLYFWRYVAYAAVYVLLHQLPKKQLLLIPELLIAAGFVAAVTGLLQYILLPDTRFLLATYWDEHYYRLLGPWLDPGFTGLILVLTILLIVEYRRYFSPATSYLLLATSFIALLLTYSRASYLALLAGAAVLSWQKRSWKLIIGIVILIGVVLPLLPHPGGEGVKLTRTKSITNRLDYSQQILPLILKYPIFGTGFNLLRYKKRDAGILESDWKRDHAGAGVDNSFLFVLSTTGIVGLASFVWLLWSQFSIFNSQFSIQATLVAVIVHSQFNNSLFYPWIMLWIWILLGSQEISKKATR